MDKYGCDRYIKFKQQVVEAAWKEKDSKWILQVRKIDQGPEAQQLISHIDMKIKDLDSGSVFTDQCDVLISATGFLNGWKWPDISGLHDFKGKLMHSAKWDENFDYSVCQPLRGTPKHAVTFTRTKELL